MQPKVLIVDDVPANRNLLADTLEPHGFEVLSAASGEAAVKTAAAQLPDVILLDVTMPPGIDGFEACRRLKAGEITRSIPVIFVTGHNDPQNIVEGFRAGGIDYVTKPFQPDEVVARVRTHAALSRMTHELTSRNAELTTANERLKAEIERRAAAEASFAEADEQLRMVAEEEARRTGLEGFVGRSPAFAATQDLIRRLQEHPFTNVLILGESGTGKELVARALHHGSTKRPGSFIARNCSAIPRELAESQLFGHLKGSFTGATSDQKGWFEMANNGTLFLDELGTLPLEQQAKLLRVLEEKAVTPLGATKTRPVKVRVVAATNADLKAEVAAGRFRADLYHRLNVFCIQLLPLRQRREDIEPLARHFVRQLALEMGQTPNELPAETVRLLETLPFPENARELKNVIERAILWSGTSPILPENIKTDWPPAADNNAGSSMVSGLHDIPWNLKEAERLLIERALKHVRNNQVQAAKLLGVDRNYIRRRLNSGQPGD